MKCLNNLTQTFSVHGWCEYDLYPDKLFSPPCSGPCSLPAPLTVLATALVVGRTSMIRFVDTAAYNVVFAARNSGKGWNTALISFSFWIERFQCARP